MKIKTNKGFENLSESYLFSEVAKRVSAKDPQGKKIISLGIGDVALPISPSVARAMARASLMMKSEKGFCGYGNTQGDLRLRDAICQRYLARGISFSPDEIFVSDGAKSDLGNINDVLGNNEVLIIDPAYPVYADASIIAGRRINRICACADNSFLPLPDKIPKKPYVIYLCSPNNPTGAVYSEEDLKKWVDFALDCGSLIVFDAAYEAFIGDCDLPHSIFEIDGARECAIEICSFSKMAGFTGVRCGWTTIPRKSELHSLWRRRQSTKFNGASHISQMGALASLCDRGANECAENITYYMENARLLADFLNKNGIFFTGGMHAPYLWVRCPEGVSSWQLFDRLLDEARVVCTPGAGFGESGEGFVRLSSFAKREDVKEAITRLSKIL